MSCSRTQHGGGRFRTPDLSLRSPTPYHWATALPNKEKIWVSYFIMRNPYMKFQTLVCMVHKIWNASVSILIFSKGHNSRKGDNSDKKKKKCVGYISMRTPYMKFQNPGSWWMNGCTDVQPETNMPRQLLRSWGHNAFNVQKEYEKRLKQSAALELMLSDKFDVMVSRVL